MFERSNFLKWYLSSGRNEEKGKIRGKGVPHGRRWEEHAKVVWMHRKRGCKRCLRGSQRTVHSGFHRTHGNQEFYYVMGKPLEHSWENMLSSFKEIVVWIRSASGMGQDDGGVCMWRQGGSESLSCSSLCEPSENSLFSVSLPLLASRIGVNSIFHWVSCCKCKLMNSYRKHKVHALIQFISDAILHTKWYLNGSC